MKYTLTKCTPSSVPTNRFDGEMRWAKCVSTYDGDSATFALKLDGKLRLYNARMYGYDSPEMKPSLKNHNRDQEKAAAILARDYLKERIQDKLCLVEFVKPSFDKFGRLLVNVYHKEYHWWDMLRNKEQYKAKAANINVLMVTEGHGVEYDGGKKTPYEINHIGFPDNERV